MFTGRGHRPSPHPGLDASTACPVRASEEPAQVQIPARRPPCESPCLGFLICNTHVAATAVTVLGCCGDQASHWGCARGRGGVSWSHGCALSPKRCRPAVGPGSESCPAPRCPRANGRATAPQSLLVFGHRPTRVNDDDKQASPGGQALQAPADAIPSPQQRCGPHTCRDTCPFT